MVSFKIKAGLEARQSALMEMGQSVDQSQQPTTAATRSSDESIDFVVTDVEIVDVDVMDVVVTDVEVMDG